jgi:hypothetical protein
MKTTPFLLILVLVVGCNRDDARLQGTWRSNRDASVAAAFKQDPHWVSATPAEIERFTNLFGHMIVTYSNNIGTSVSDGKVTTIHYSVVRRGSDYVVIRPDNWPYDTRISFVDGDTGYWVHSSPDGTGSQERYDKFQK